MFHGLIPKSIFARSRASRRRSHNARQTRRLVLWPERLEDRITLTANIAVTGVAVVNSNDVALSVINPGEYVYIKVSFTTQNLPANASYRAAFDVNGLTMDSTYGTLGAGYSSGSWYIYWGSFVATPGANTVTATVDPDDSVAETTYADNTSHYSFNAVSPSVGNLSYNPAQIRDAYGITNIPNFGSSTADGTGQTIAIVDIGNDPTIFSDLDGFDQAMGLTEQAGESLEQQYGPASSILSVYNQSGTNITSRIGTSGSNGVPPLAVDGWYDEITLDVEWAHAIAPGARIDLIETTAGSGSGDLDGLLSGVATAATLPGVSVVSNSWCYEEFSGETAYDPSTFVTPSGHTGVTFLAATGDDGEFGEYPAYSPNVVAVGGTQLTTASNRYGTETGWSFPTPRTLDNGASSYSQTGSWTTQTGGFSGPYSTASAHSNASAAWTSTISSSDQGWLGGTEVSATWKAAPGNATNATYTIYDGNASTGAVLGTVVVDQTKAPQGTAVGSSQFQELGTYFPSSGTLTVVLNAQSANGKVVADAVGIAQAWASSGGQSQYEPEPSYQLPFQSTGARSNPDVSFDGATGSGVTCYENGNLSYDYYGTSLACPCWAGLIAIANQGRVAEGAPTLDSPTNPTQTLQAIYSLPSTDYHDVTTGYNGDFAGTGYDEVTGLGSPIANLLVPALTNFETTDYLTVTAQPPAAVTAGSAFGLTLEVDDSSGNLITSYNGNVTISLAANPSNATLQGTLTAQAVNGVVTFNGLTLDTAGIGYQIQATASGLASATTNPFNVQAAGATQLVIAAEPPATVGVGSPFGLTLDVEDSFGNLVTDDNGIVTLSLAVNPSNATLQGTLSNLVVNGVVSFNDLTLYTAGIGFEILATSPGLASATTSPFDVEPSVASQLVIAAEPPASVSAGSPFGLSVDVEDSFGDLLASFEGSVTIALAANPGTGSLGGTLTASAVNGVVTFNGLFLDSPASGYAIQATSPGLTPATSNLFNVVAGAASELVITAEPPTTVIAGGLFGLTVAVEDAFGNLVTSDNASVTLSSSNPALGGILTVSVVNGVATFNGLTLDKAGLGFVIQAASPGLTSASTTPINVQAAGASKLVVTSQPPATVSAGSVFGLTVAVEDPFGNLITADNGSVTIGIGTNPGSGILGGSLTTSAVNGVASFSNLVLNTAGIGYTLNLSRSGLSGATTSSFTVNPSTASKLVITQAQSSGIVAGAAFGLVVAIEDSFGNVEIGSNALVTASLKSGAGPLLGTTTVSASSGLATFANLADDKAEIIALNVSSPGLTGTFTVYFPVAPAPASRLVIQTQPSTSSTVNQPFPIQPVVYEEDAFGNLETVDNTTVVTASLASGAGPLLGTTTAVVSAGVAKFTNLGDTKGETITLAFGSGALSRAVSSSIVVNKMTPTITVTRSAATAIYKQSMTFTVAVAPASGGTTPTGSVTFLDGSTVLGSATLNGSGHASFSTTALPLGMQSITAKYAGDSTNAPVTSTATSVYVGDLPNDDFDGDGKADAAVFGLNPTTGKYGFTIVTSSSGFKSTVLFNNFGYGFGNAQSIPVVGDYFGDGKDSYALWTPNSLGGMTFTAVSSVSYKTVTANFGGVNQIPVVADVDGDGKADFGVYGYLPGHGYSFDFLLSSDNFNVNQQDLFNNNGYGYGNATSVPVVADFDGNGKADFGLYNPAKIGATFTYIDPSTYQSITQSIPLSLVSPNAIPMAVQYDGDSKADLALYGSSATNANQYGYVVLTAASGFNPSQALTFNNNGYGYGNSSSIPVTADFDGTGKDDFAVYTPDFNGGMEYVFQTSQTGAGVTVDFPSSLTELPLATSPAFLAKKVRGS
jgi:hypothetical protein